MTTHEYDILPSKSNINSYNRYPFKNLEEAIDNLHKKSLQPGELAVAYYWDETSYVGISSIFAIGNLKKHGNLIFKNAKLLEHMYHDMLNKLAMQHKAIDECIQSINMANKNYGIINNTVCSVKDYAEKLNDKIVSCSFVDLDTYTEDL